MEDEFDIIGDIGEILSLGVMSTPALMINGKVVSSGRIPTVEDVKDFISKAK